MNFDCLEISEDGKTLTGIKDKTINSVVIPDSIITIGFKAFAGCKNLSSVTIGKSVANISFSAFGECCPLKSIVFHCQQISHLGGCSVEEIVIGKEVIKISNGVFSNCRNLHSIVVINDNVVYDSRDNSNAIIETATNELIAACVNSSIPHSVKSIGHHAFSQIDGLGIMNNSHISIPDSVVEIGEAAFAWSDIVSINIPRSVNSIGASAFERCNYLKTVGFSDGIDEIKNHTFSHCENLTSIIIPNTVVSIGSEAFYGCKKLSTLLIPDNVSYIGFGAFKDCTGLNEVHITNLEKWCTIEFVDSSSNPLYYAHHFYLDREEITKLVIPPSVHVVKKYAFECCDNITSVIISDSVTVIEKMAFSGCIGLKNIKISNSVTSLGKDAFSGCKSLTTVTIPKNVISIDENTFNGCLNIESIDVDDENKYYSSIDGILFDKSRRRLLRYPFNHCNLEYVVPDNVFEIGPYAFSYCEKITKVFIPNSVEHIRNDAFRGCKSLQTIKLSERVSEISDYLFCDCCSLQSLFIPCNIKRIGECAFDGCNSLCLKIPESVVDIVDLELYANIGYEDCISVSRLLSFPEKMEVAIPRGKDFENLFDDEVGVAYSTDGKRLIQGENIDLDNTKCNSYRIRTGIETICDYSHLGYTSELDTIHVPSTNRYVGMDALKCESLVLEGIDTFFCKNFWQSEGLGTLYVPFKTKENYVLRLKGRSYDKGDKKCNYRIIELSKSKLISLFKNQQRILINMISDIKPVSIHTFNTLNDNKEKYICVNGNDLLFITRINPDVDYFLSVLSTLGMTFSELCEILGITTEIIPIQESVGRTLVQRVEKEFDEDFIDEDTGEVFTVKRSEILLDPKCLDINDIKTLTKEGISSVWVYSPNTPLEYIHYFDSDSDYYSWPYSKDIVIKRLFLTNEMKDDNIQKAFANKLACIYKNLVESDGCAGNIQVVLENIDEPCHILTTEENNVISLINEFYDDKIKSISNCETELDIMPLFTTDEETYYQLKRFLQKRNVSESIMFSYVTQFFEQHCGRIIDVTDCQQDVSKLP